MTAQRFSVFSLLSFLCFVDFAVAAVQEGSIAVPADAPAEAGLWKKVGLEALIGPSILEGNTGVALGLRGHIKEKWLVEWGGVLPHSVSDLADDSKRFIAGADTAQTSAQVDSYAEMHWSLLYRIYARPKWNVTGGAGVSLGFVRNAVDTVVSDPLGNVLYTFHEQPHRTRWGPRVQLGVQSPLTPHLSLGLHVAWVSYANEETRGGQNHDLDFSGLLLEPMVQWRF